jgi:hypothetical protein
MEEAGDAPCPSGFPARHLVGTDVDYTCSSCVCAITAACSGTMNVYTDGACTNLGVTLKVDGACNPVPSQPGEMYASYKYVANPAANVQCTSSGTSSAQNVALAGVATVCCP